MLNRLMITAATVALIAGTGLANAQGTGMGREGSSAGSAAQQSQGAAPSSERGNSAAPANRDATESTGPSGMKSTRSEEKMQAPGGNNPRAQQDMKSGPKDEKSAQDMKNNNSKGDRPKSMSSQNEKGAAGKDMKAEGREDRNGNIKAEGRNGNMNADSRNATDKNATESRSQTVGQAGAGARTLNRATHQDHDRDQGSARGSDHQCQLRDCGRYPRSAQRHLPSASGGNRVDLSGLAWI